MHSSNASFRSEKNKNSISMDKNIEKRKKTNPKQLSLVDDENTIFVGNLPNTINVRELKNLFQKFGNIVSARLRCAIRKDLKTTKKVAVIKKEFHEDGGHINGYVKFEKLASCRTALKMNGVLHEGRHLRVNFASDEGKSDPRKSIFLGNLPFKVQDDHVWEVFEDCGEIESVRVVRDEQTGIGKGFGYVNFKKSDSVELALQLNGVAVLDRNVRVSRVVNDRKKFGLNIKQKRLNDPKPRNKSKPERKGKVTKPSEKTKVQNEFQGEKTKRTIHKKIKKKKYFDKKKMLIKQIADGMKKMK